MARKRKPSGRLPDKGRRLGRRAVAQREPRPVFLIVCEGKQTEPNYFRGFRVNAVVVEVVGVGRSPRGVVAEAERLSEGKGYTETWVVFDKDDFTAEEFNGAVEQAQREGFGVAYSNQAFELWYVLHFDYHDTSLSRRQYQKILSQKLGRAYRKNDLSLYDDLLERQQTAIGNAQRLLDSYVRHNPAQDDPCTTVHELVRKLNECAD